MSRGIRSIIIVPHDKGHSRTLRVSHRLLKIAAGSAVFLFVAVSFAMVHYAVLLRRSAEMDRVAAENRGLREKVSAIEALNSRLDDYESYVRRIDFALGLGGADAGPPAARATMLSQRAGAGGWAVRRL